MRVRECISNRIVRSTTWIEEDGPLLSLGEIIDVTSKVNCEAWHCAPKGACRIVETCCSAPSWWERLWAWLYGRRAVYQVKVVFSIEPGLSDPMESKR